MRVRGGGPCIQAVGNGYGCEGPHLSLIVYQYGWTCHRFRGFIHKKLNYRSILNGPTIQEVSRYRSLQAIFFCYNSQVVIYDHAGFFECIKIPTSSPTQLQSSWLALEESTISLDVWSLVLGTRHLVSNKVAWEVIYHNTRSLYLLYNQRCQKCNSLAISHGHIDAMQHQKAF